jgi:hypothetical protein
LDNPLTTRKIITITIIAITTINKDLVDFDKPTEFLLSTPFTINKLKNNTFKKVYLKNSKVIKKIISLFITESYRK